jgi:WD40 repeat protein
MTEITTRQTTTNDKDFSYWDEIEPIVHYPVHVTAEQIVKLYEKLDFRYTQCDVKVFGLVEKYIKCGDSGEIYVHDSGTGVMERRIETGHDGACKRVDCWRGDIVHIVTAGSDGTARVLNYETGKYCRKLIGHDGPLNCVRVSEDEDFRKVLVVTGCKDCKVRVFYLCSGRIKYKAMEGHKWPVMAVDFMEVMGGISAIVSSDINGEIRLWDRETGTCLRVFEAARKMKPPKVVNKKKKMNLGLLAPSGAVKEGDEDDGATTTEEAKK